MELSLEDIKNKFKISSKIFDIAFNEPLVHQIITAYKANARKGTSSQKNRAEVTGSNKKPWRQKGTGRARSGSVKSPIWRSGGVTFAAKPQSYNQKINKKMYRGAIKSIISELFRQNRLIIFKEFSLEKPKTKLLLKKLNSLLIKNILIIISNFNKNLFLASRNLYKINVIEVRYINPINLINHDKIIITIDALKRIENILI